MAISNSGRSRILDRIRGATVTPDPAVDGVPITMDRIFAPIPEPMNRFLAECEANLIEAALEFYGIRL